MTLEKKVQEKKFTCSIKKGNHAEKKSVFKLYGTYFS